MVRFSCLLKVINLKYPQMKDNVDMAIQVGGAREGQSFVLKI
jgi:hypothetical protein